MTRGRRQSGMSLIEMMIAMVLGLILIGGIGQIFLSSRQSFATQSGLGAIQENGRFALQFLQRDVRQSGYPKNAVATIPAVVTATPASDSAGFTNFAVTSEGGAGASDVLTLAFDGELDPTTRTAQAVADCLGNNVTNKDKVNTDADATKTPFRVYVSYYVATVNNVRSLMCRGNGDSANPAVIATGVDAFEVLYGEDTDGDLFSNVYRKADQVANWNNVVSVRVGLLLSSRDQADSSQTAQVKDTRTYAVLDETFGPYNDNFLRRVFSSTIEIRNRTL